jgi:hypothetical protein
MHLSSTAAIKTIHVIGDSHALAFKGKVLTTPDNDIAVISSVAYVRGLTATNMIVKNQFNPELGSYFVGVGLLGQDGVSLSMTTDVKLIAEQYATGSSFDRPIFVFNVGEIFLRKFLGTVYTLPEIDLNEVSVKFRQIVTKYVDDIIRIREYFQCLPVIHEVCPPTANDETFRRINNFECSGELRGALYRAYNKVLKRKAQEHAIGFITTSDYMSKDNLLSAEYEFDGVHADPKYASISLKRIVRHWMLNRTQEQTIRYYSWRNQLPRPAEVMPEPLTVSKVFHPFSDDQIEALKASAEEFVSAICRDPALDWAHLPPWTYPKLNDQVNYSNLSVDGLKILHDVLLTGEINATLRAHVGGHFSIVNARVVQSLAHPNTGAGQQSMHRDGCPHAIFRGLIYLTDVDDGGGPFAYLPRDDDTEETRVTGKPGSLILFDANAVRHRATPPRTHERIAIDLVLLVHPPECTPIAHSRVNFTWPVDPYMFGLSERCYPPVPSGRWFYPSMVIPAHTGPVKKLSQAEMALAAEAPY